MTDRRTRSLWVDAGSALLRDRAATSGAVVIAIIALAAIVGPALSPYAYDALDWNHIAEGPRLGNAHWLGTDRLGRDLFVRTLCGARISLLIGLLATLVSVSVGLAWGSIAGFVGGRTDELMMRVVDVLYSLPYIFIVIILGTLFGRGNLHALFVAIGAVGWLTTARIVRGQTLALKRREFIEAAHITGVDTLTIIWRHVVPNLVGPVIIYATMTVPQMMLFESFLSFLGLGVQEPLASLGSLINQGAREMESAPWMLLVPAGVLIVLLASFNFLGDGLRDALDPRNATRAEATSSDGALRARNEVTC